MKYKLTLGGITTYFGFLAAAQAPWVELLGSRDRKGKTRRRRPGPLRGHEDFKVRGRRNGRSSGGKARKALERPRDSGRAEELGAPEPEDSPSRHEHSPVEEQGRRVARSGRGEVRRRAPFSGRRIEELRPV